MHSQFRNYFSIEDDSSARRDGRVVDYSGLENRRAERHRGFESLSLRYQKELSKSLSSFFVYSIVVSSEFLILSVTL